MHKPLGGRVIEHHLGVWGWKLVAEPQGQPVHVAEILMDLWMVEYLENTLSSLYAGERPLTPFITYEEGTNGEAGVRRDRWCFIPRCGTAMSLLGAPTALGTLLGACDNNRSEADQRRQCHGPLSQQTRTHGKTHRHTLL